jgi:hypothetical protein
MDGPTATSDIRIDREGAWFYRGVEMSRREIVALFYRHLQQDAAGCYFIEIGRQRYRIEVEDTAYVVWAVRWVESRDEAEECAYLLLSDGSTEKLDPATLRIGAGNVPYCKVRNRRFDARYSRSAYYQLAEHVRHDSMQNAYFIALNGRPYYII